MLDIDFDALIRFFQTNWGWAAGVASSMFSLTVLAGGLLNQERKESIALWLMGAQTEENWSHSFNSMFDAVFGGRHLSLRCLARSTVASLIAVSVIWLLMGEFGALGRRIQEELSLGRILAIALVVNVVADYVSLLETRLILSHIHRVRSAPAQIGVLFLDFLVSAGIIWVAIAAYLNSPLYTGEKESFAEVIGLFSTFSVIFYSTFLTSVWSWAYVSSTWALRLVKRFRLADFLDVEHKPIRILALFLALIVFVGALLLALPLQKNSNEPTVIDQALCSLFQGRVCLDVARLPKSDWDKIKFIVLACGGPVGEGGAIPHECLWRELDEISEGRLNPDEVGFDILAFYCLFGYLSECSPAGWQYLDSHRDRHFIDKGTYSVAIMLFSTGCAGGNSRSCDSLALLHLWGHGVHLDTAEAARLFRKSCEIDPTGCESVRFAAEAPFYREFCENGQADSCQLLGHLLLEGIGMDPDPVEAARFYRQACEEGEALSCKLADRIAAD